MALRKGFQSDGETTLERIALRLVGGSGTEVAYYKFQINPQNYKETSPQRATVFRTRSAIVVEDFGPDIVTIEFSGTTGFKRDKTGRTGADRLQALKAIIEQYSTSGQRIGEEDSQQLEMIFYNFTDGGSYYVHLAPGGFEIERSAEQSILYNYRLSLVVLREAGDPDVRDIDNATIGNGTFYETTSQAINPNSSTAQYNKAIHDMSEIVDFGG